jgi:hypothetical protein
MSRLAKATAYIDVQHSNEIIGSPSDSHFFFLNK